MGLSSLFTRRTDAAVATEPADDVQRARTRARQRLIGAVVLLGIGVVGFPLLFETQPRPIPVDIPIEIPRREGMPPLTIPSARPLAVAPDASAANRVAPVEPPAAADAEGIITEPRQEPAGPAPAARPPEHATSLGTPPAPAPTPQPAKEARVATAPATPRPAVDEDARARALLEGRSAPASDATRFIVQVGAFADAAAAHDTRLKVEKLGLKTYTQVASTAAGGRIRVRVGPFATRDEADKALARARSAGLSAVVMTL